MPEQVINIEDAVYAYTMGSAYANLCEDNPGSISPGKYADLVVLSQDIYRRPLIASRSIGYVPRKKVPRKNGKATSV